MRVRHEKVCFTHTFWCRSIRRLPSTTRGYLTHNQQACAPRSSPHPSPINPGPNRHNTEGVKPTTELSLHPYRLPTNLHNHFGASHSLQTATHKRTKISSSLILELESVARATGYADDGSSDLCDQLAGHRSAGGIGALQL